MFNLLPTYKKVGLISSIIGTVLMTGGFALMLSIPGADKSDSVIGNFISVFVAIGIIATIVAYATGGLIEAIKIAFGIGKWGWLLMSFPMDIVTGLITTMLAFYVLVVFPVYPVYKNCRNYIEDHIAIDGNYI